MKKHIAIIFMLSIAIISCKEKPAYEKEGWTDKQFQPETLLISKATINGNPIILSKEELIEIEGKPIDIRDSCTIIPIRYLQGIVVYECWIYDSTWNMVYEIYNDIAFLSRLNFEEYDLKIEMPQITLSKDTKFREIKDKFPNSYAHRNIGANYYEQDGYDWIYLLDDIQSEGKLYPSQIELIFKGGKLKRMEYDWQPTYTKEQLEIYKQQQKEYEQKNE